MPPPLEVEKVRKERGGATMFGWTYLDGTGEELGTSEGFPDTESAEEWMSVSWQDLVENGVEEVVLYDKGRGRHLYRMGLRPE